MGTLSFLVAKPKGTPAGASGAWSHEPSHIRGLFLEHSSRRSPRVCISTFGAETLAGAKGCQVAQYWSGLMYDIDSRMCFLPQVRTDANSLFTALSKLTSRPQEVNLVPVLDQFRDDVYCGRVGVAWIPTEHQVSDALTKFCIQLIRQLREWMDSGTYPLKAPEDGTLREKRKTRALQKAEYVLQNLPGQSSSTSANASSVLMLAGLL